MHQTHLLDWLSSPQNFGKTIKTPDQCHQTAIVETILKLSEAAAKIATEIRNSATAHSFGSTQGSVNVDGDAQKGLDVFADITFLEAAKAAPVGVYASEEQDGACMLDDAAPLTLAIDPLDGSSNIDVNVTIGAIFSLLPRKAGQTAHDSVLQPGHRQCAAGFFLFGPQTWLVLSIGGPVTIFAHDRTQQNWLCIHKKVEIPKHCKDFAINASNRRYWQAPIQNYISDCESGLDGSRGQNFNMRWVASLVADACRILLRGGIFLYPADEREGYKQGRLRLVYEANPISYIVTHAGGAALCPPCFDSTSVADKNLKPILDLIPNSVHERTPLAFGSLEEAKILTHYFT